VDEATAVFDSPGSLLRPIASCALWRVGGLLGYASDRRHQCEARLEL